jgi:hypothetical protein
MKISDKTENYANNYNNFLANETNTMLNIISLFITTLIIGIVTLNSILAFIPLVLLTTSLIFQYKRNKWTGIAMKDYVVMRVMSENNCPDDVKEINDNLEEYTRKAMVYSQTGDKFFVYGIISLIFVIIIYYLIHSPLFCNYFSDKFPFLI